MGKVKTIVMGDEKAEEAIRQKAKAKREAKSAQGRSASGGKEEPKEIPKQVRDDKKKTTKITSRGKKYVKVVSLVDKKKKYSLADALDLVKKTSYSSFDGSVEAVFNVVEKGVRGSVALPHGTGKTIRIKIANDELVSAIENGRIDFDILVAHPSMMPKLAKIAKILGPKGLMPNPKTGTISENPEDLIKTLSSSLSWRTEGDFPIIHSVIGKVSFDEKKLSENFAALLKSIGKDKIVSIFLKATMGPSVRVQI